MTTLVMLVGQVGVVVAGFIGTSIAVKWYHEGGEKNEKTTRPHASSAHSKMHGRN